MRALLLLAALAGCASMPANDVRLLKDDPGRAYRSLGYVQAEGRPGTDRGAAYDELRGKAREMGADAVLVKNERKFWRRPTPPEAMEDRPSLGDPYPQPLERTRPGSFGYEGTGAQVVSGTYWRVEGEAIDLQ